MKKLILISIFIVISSNSIQCSQTYSSSYAGVTSSAQSTIQNSTSSSASTNNPDAKSLDDDEKKSFNPKKLAEIKENQEIKKQNYWFTFKDSKKDEKGNLVPVSFKTTKRILEQSKLIRTALEGDKASGTKKDNPFPLLYMTKQEFKIVFKIMDRANDEILLLFKIMTLPDIKKYINKFRDEVFNIDFVRLIYVASFLDMQSVFTHLCRIYSFDLNIRIQANGSIDDWKMKKELFLKKCKEEIGSDDIHNQIMQEFDVLFPEPVKNRGFRLKYGDDL